MDHREVGRYWESNARAWTLLSRQGWDVYRDAVNTPAFLRMLPDVTAKKGLDIGCGDGHNTRLIAGRGARMFAVDIAPSFLRYAAEAETKQGGAIRYVNASALQLPFASDQFDFAVAVMSLMDMPDQGKVLEEIHRVLRGGGFLQFSITHPSFSPPYRRLLRAPEGEAYAVEVGRYFDRVNDRVDRWLFSAAPQNVKAGLKPFEIPFFHRTLSDWFNAVLRAGFQLEEVSEPRADDETARAVPAVQDTQVVAYFLHVRCRKPAGG
jgi:ubiquinone/menaquinone biosynthesis C-methylase UbiE